MANRQHDLSLFPPQRTADSDEVPGGTAGGATDDVRGIANDEDEDDFDDDDDEDLDDSDEDEGNDL
jgi:hypothetical protein